MSGRVGHAGLLLDGVVATDPFFSSVVALLHLDGTNGSTTFTDQKAHSFTSIGGASLSTTGPKFGSASLAMNGTSQAIQSATSTDWEFGSGDFTIELWIFPTSISSSALMDLVVRWASFGFGLGLDQTTGYIRAYVQNSGGAVFVTSTAAPAINSWSHVAYVRDGATLRTYLNGVQVGSAAISGSINTISSPLYVGSEAAAIRWFPGRFDELRITKGVCRYPGGTTFAVPTAAFPNS